MVASAPQDVRVGSAGWSYPDWEGPVYPRPHPRGFDPLAFLARYLDLVEVNASFYALPRADVARRWVRRVADRPGFSFLAKVHRELTHEPGNRLSPTTVRAFLEGVRPLEEAGRLSALLAQFPVSFRHDAANLGRLADLAEHLDRVPLVVELRHRSWFEAGALDRVGALGLSVAWIDLPAAADHPPPDVPRVGPVGYVRLHGRNAAAWFDRRAGRDERYDWLYAPDDLDRIAARVREAAAGGRRTYLVTNNHYGGKAVANALELKGRLAGTPPLAPETVRRAFPRLVEATRLDGQPSLF